MKAKVTYFAAILTSPDPMVQELKTLLSASSAQRLHGVDEICTQFMAESTERVLKLPVSREAVGQYQSQRV